VKGFSRFWELSRLIHSVISKSNSGVTVSIKSRYSMLDSMRDGVFGTLLNRMYAPSKEIVQDFSLK